MDFTWLAEEQELSAAALTVRAQAISPNDNGQLLWDAFFPRANVPSVKLSEVTSLDWRPTADRREWNMPGRLIPLLTPATKLMTMVPIESFFQIAEEEMQALVEQNLSASQQQFRNLIRASIPDRVDTLVESNYRRIEVDALNAWANGTIVQKNPENGLLYTASYGFAAERMRVAATPWNDVGVNAYDELIAFAEDSIDKVGSIVGVALRLTTFRAIQADAPQLIAGVTPTRSEVEARISDQLGTPFRFYILENTVDVFTDGGVAYSRVKLWPTGKVAAVPAGEAVGNTAFAPVARAVDIDASAPGAEVDVRGMTVWHETSANGKRLTIECQVNAAPVPDERRVNVIDAGV